MLSKYCAKQGLVYASMIFVSPNDQGSWENRVVLSQVHFEMAHLGTADFYNFTTVAAFGG